MADSTHPQAAVEGAVTDALGFIVKTNTDYAAWCKTFYVAEALDKRGMKSLDGLWAWQEQERRQGQVADLAAEFERGRQQGMDQERALWELAADGQAMEQSQGQAAPVVPEGWMLVPKKLTAGMFATATRKVDEWADVDEIWRELLAAVPAVPLPSAQSQGACPAGTALSAPAATRRPLQSHGAKCWRCKGSGDMEVTAGQGPDTWTETTICSQCGGTGVEDD